MRRHERHVDRLARAEIEIAAAAGEIVAPGQVAVAAAVEALMLLSAARPDRRRRGKIVIVLVPRTWSRILCSGSKWSGVTEPGELMKTKPRCLSMAPVRAPHDVVQRRQRLEQEIAEDLVLLDELQHHPRAALLDPADRLLDGKAVARRGQRVDPERRVAGIIFDVDRPDALASAASASSPSSG